MSKCNLKYPGECVNVNPQSRVCGINHPCPHKVTLPEPVKGLTCPKCTTQLLQSDGGGDYFCRKCGYRQPDSDQRPKMPDAPEGHRLIWDFPFMGLLFEQNISHTFVKCDEPVWHECWGKRWIAVKDEVKPAFPPPPAGETWHNTDKLTPEQVGIADGWRLLLASEIGKSSSNGSGLFANCDARLCTEEWQRGNHGWDAEITYRTREPLPVKPAVEPVVRYWQHGDYFTKTIDGVPVEAVDCGRVRIPLKTDVPCGHCQSITPAEYEAAKQPKPEPVLEPVKEVVKICFEDQAAVEALFQNDKRISKLEDQVSALMKAVNRLEGAKE